MKTIRVLGAMILAVVSLAAFAGADKKVEDTLEERIKAVGSVCMEGEDCAAAPVAAVSSDEPRSGQVVYETKCSSCHASGAAGAPKFADVGAWSPRLGKGIEVLYSSAINGFQGMPAKGLCFDCSDEEINAAVDYMVEGSK